MPSVDSFFNKIIWGFKLYFAFCLTMSVFLQVSICVSLTVIFLPVYFVHRPWYQWLFQRISEVYMLFYPFTFYHLCGNRIIETGDELEVNENALFIMNHTHFYDFLAIVLSAPRCGRIGAMRFFMKEDIRKIPFVGFGFWVMDNIFLKRSFAEDAPYILETFKRFRNKYYPFWLTIYPEGTRNKPDKLVKSQEFCSQNNLPILNNILNPRPTGVIVTLQQLRNVVPYVYDVTLGYPIKPTPACVFCFNEGITIHMNIRKIETKNIPTDPEDIKTWLNDIWIEKDELMNYFKEHHHFPGDGRTPPFSFTWANFDGYMTPECFKKP